ncbi:helicase domino isoform X2 [Phlebotomus argentipes]|uniref:helicase domino isoform X2 n=1 Tax=Phlebotomus argentipes TaxID=94469 RepID=UPI0028932763|nr:helicase domino isoform X2 [Phlebotomus argentipes]
MNEADSAGGPRGRSSAPPAAADRRSLNLTAGTAVRVSGASALINPQQMSRLAADNRVLLMSSSSPRSQQQPGQGNLIFISTAAASGDLSGGNLNSISGGVVLRTHAAAGETSSGIVGVGNVTGSVVSSTATSTALASVQEATIVTTSSGDLHNLLSAQRKRVKVEDRDSIAAIKKRILEHKYSRLRSLKDKHTEHVAELFFLQASGNMMDYPTWRKKPQTPELINFAKTWRLDQTASASDDTAAKLLQNSSGQSYGTEIKIPGVGVTPVAVSTTLPTAVVQLTQQGHIPGRPQGGRHGMVFGQIPVPTTQGNLSIPLVPGGTPLVPETSSGVDAPDKKPLLTSIAAPSTPTTPVTVATAAAGAQEQFSVKAKQEVYVMQRVSELQREGLWAEKRLPKLQEPSRTKAHWDYLLEEMVWLSADFAQERKWKKAAAKKCARMVQKYFQDKALAAQRAERAQEAQLKRIAAFVAKEIKVFWSNVEKLVEYKQQTKLEEKRKKALDQHLSFIVDQTEKFSQQLAEGMNKSVVDGSAAPSLNSSRISSPKRSAQSDDEFSPGNELSDDDEETIAKAEAEATCVNEEILALQRESEMDFDDFLKELPKDYLKNRENIVLSDDDDNGGREDEKMESSGDEEFKATASSTDDEESIMEQENKEKNKDHKKEIAELEADNEMSIEDLMAKYKTLSKAEKMEVDSDDDDDETSDDEGSDDKSENESEEEEEESEEDEPKDDGLSLQNLFNEDGGGNNKDQLIDDAAAIAESIQPKGNTLSSTNVVTEVPFLLKHTLREYQHIGLDWLVTMHDRKLNGILADEMGLGKTIQTISLLAHLACCKGNWGPHLIIVPSSVMLNWEMEFKKWCPGFKILTYYGNQKERKAKRIGWTKANAFHICITSYKLVIQDHQSFRRKKWKYLILDEAQNIKNFKSQRWQLLLNFQTEQRLLLTGTPLQNNLMELWSLMHFLMPHVFQSHKEFKEWFSNPMTGMIEGNSEYNDSIIKRLHKVLRPFLLRRLKCEVEKQMPKKYEHVVMCRLSKRQRYLYDDFMSRAKTRETLASGNLLSVINVLMQLRKVCNHPNLFEVRPTISPFRMDGIKYWTASLVCNVLDYNPLEQIDLHSLNLVLINLELSLTAYVAHRSKQLSTPRKLIEEIDTAPELPPQCPTGKLRLHVKVRDGRVQETLSGGSVKVGTSPAMRVEGTKYVPIAKFLTATTKSGSKIGGESDVATIAQIVQSTSDGGSSSGTQQIGGVQTSTVVVNSTSPGGGTATINLRRRHDLSKVIGENAGMIVQTSNGRHILIPTSSTAGTATTVFAQNGQRLTVVSKNIGQVNKITQHVITKPIFKMSPLVGGNSQPLAAVVAQHLKYYSAPPTTGQPAVVNQTVESEFLVAETEEARRERRVNQLRLLSRTNRRRIDATPVYGEDLRESIVDLSRGRARDEAPWTCRSYETCQYAMKRQRRDLDTTLTSTIKTYEERTRDLSSIFNNFVTFVPNVSAPMPTLHVSHPSPSRYNEERDRQTVMQEELSSKLILLHPIISAMSTQFPDPRLIQYDCGKLQTLNRLLRKLKTDGHRVLIFTQMTRMLDVLEAFLNYHGHIYLRLDGTTRIEQRQILMERFNGDKRIFVFILSTRSGGVGVNLTGADTVIFYDSDWNPTMDAQAQDRCHRIGQTRDVHIYRLVSEKTIEENILKKANQKRLLGDLAIEGGNFTTAFFKSSTIQDLFNVDTTGSDASSRFQELLDRDKERKQKLYESIAGPSVVPDESKQNVGAFETALAAAEDEQDVQAAKTATAEAAADLAEFDENIPLEDIAEKTQEVSKADQEVEHLMKQLSPIERYAMRFVEETGGAWTAEQLKAAEAEIEQQKREWEANRQAALLKEEEEMKQAEEEDIMLTYSSEDAKNQIWISDKTGDLMPMWCPPTPPQDDNDLYTDFSLGYLYELETMPESQLPPVYVKKEYKRSRSEAGLYVDSRRQVKVRKEDTYYPPRSLFDRPSPALAKMRRDLKLQKYRGIFKPTLHMAAVKHQITPVKPLVEPEGMIEWFIYEDMAMLNVIQNLQGFNLSLVLVSPGHTPNWDLVADIVNQTSRTYRSPKQCRYRYEAVIVPREEGKLQESPKKQKKSKHQQKGSIKNCRSMRTSQLYASDNNSSFTKLMRQKFDNIKTVMMKKAPQLKQMLVNPTMKNPKHAALLAEYGITNYDSPPSPMEIAQRRVDRITKEKQKLTPASQAAAAAAAAAAQMPELTTPTTPGVATVSQQMASRQEITVPAVLQQPQTIVVQQQSPAVLQTPVAALVQSSTQLQTIRAVQSAVNISQQQSPQIVKAIVASGQNIIATPVQQIAVAQASAQATAGQGQQGVTGSPSGQQATQQTVVVPSSVSVVLTTPVTTISSGQTTQQIVSIHQATVSNASSAAGTLVQTIASSVPQVMSQLPTVGTVIATTALPPNATVATLTTSALRAQRIVPANLQEVVLHQRGGSQSPTVVSVSGLGQGLTPAHLQAAQFRLSMAAAAAGGQHVVAAAKGIPLGSVTTSPANKAVTTSHPQIQFYRQQSIRQQLKVLHTAPASGTPGQQQSGTTAAVVQTAGGQTTLVSPAGAIIQGGIVQATGNLAQAVQVQQAGGQKVAVASVSGAPASGVVTNVATVQVTPGQQARTQFIKQVGGKQTTIARQVTDNEMQAIMMKRQIINQQHKGQVLPQAQIFAPTSVQMQQATSSATVAVGGQQAAAGGAGAQQQAGQQQIATLVKTSTGTVAAAAPGMTFSQVKPNQLKATAIASPGQTRPVQIQQQIAITPQRKPKVAQITQVAGKAGVQTQLIVQNPKGLPVTMQQLFRQGQQGIVLSKSRVIPVSMASQPNNRQTIQVVTAPPGAQTLRTHVTPGNLTGTLQGAIKVAAAAGATQAQQQQALLTAFQNQQNQRQNVSPVRLQTSSGGSLVALAVQQAPQIVTQSTSGAGSIVEVAASGSAGGSGQAQQQQAQQQSQNPHHSQSK